MITSRSLSSLLVSALALLLPSSACLAQVSDDAKGAGKVIADSGFRPKPSGFSFENWGGDTYPHSDLTPSDAVALFGERVCARWEGESCIPNPAAKTWLNEMNQMMKGGHCEGMAALSAAFHVKEESPADYGAKEAFQLSPKDDPLMSSISEYFATQALEPVQSVTASTREWPLQKIVDTIVSSLQSGKDYPTLGIYGQDGGHAITPYRVEQVADGAYRVYVYDNNYPGAEKYVEIDAKNNRWRYAGAALNPKEDPAPWEGSAGDMDVTLLSTRYEPLACPFCGPHQPPRAPARPPAPAPAHPRKPSVPSDSYSVITPSRCSQVQAVRKKDKKQLSAGKSGVKKEIAGASMARLRGSRGCYVKLPANEQYDISLVDDGRPLLSPAAELFIFALGRVYGVSGMSLSPGTSQVFSISDSGFSYQAGGSQKPTLIVATDSDRPDAYYEVSGFTINNGYAFSAESAPDGAVTFSDNDPDLDSFDVHGEIVGDARDEEVSLEDLSAGDRGDVELEVEKDGDLDVDIDSDADGTEDEQDADDDNDGTPDAKDTDDDNDGTLDAQETHDGDHDGTSDEQDADDDNDGTPDASDADDDNDGTPDASDASADGAEGEEGDSEDDGSPDDSSEADAAADESAEQDSDNDGTADEQDADDDNDGTPDAADTDDDNDGTPDEAESEGSSQEDEE